jgi:hypothetical protein
MRFSIAASVGSPAKFLSSNGASSKRVPTKAQTGPVVFDLRLSAVNEAVQTSFVCIIGNAEKK